MQEQRSIVDRAHLTPYISRHDTPQLKWYCHCLPAEPVLPFWISLDHPVNDIDGFVLLDLLKHDAETSHVPIHVISGVDRIGAVMDMGAFGVTEKPADDATLQTVFSELKEHVAKQKPKFEGN